MRRNPLRRSLPSFPWLPCPPAANRERSREERNGGARHPRRESESSAHCARRFVWPQTTLSLLTSPLRWSFCWQNGRRQSPCRKAAPPVRRAFKPPGPRRTARRRDSKRQKPDAGFGGRDCSPFRGAADAPRRRRCARLRKSTISCQAGESQYCFSESPPGFGAAPHGQGAARLRREGRGKTRNCPTRSPDSHSRSHPGRRPGETRTGAKSLKRHNLKKAAK